LLNICLIVFLSKLNGTQKLLAFTDDVGLLGGNIDTTKKNTETLIDTSKVVGPEINVEKTKYMLLSGSKSGHEDSKQIV
jgi:hypothetical protein